jgi:hypothetical protein
MSKAKQEMLAPLQAIAFEHNVNLHSVQAGIEIVSLAHDVSGGNSK